ncbi:ubiquitin-conjugating enzyme [Apiospora saccharicola]
MLQSLEKCIDALYFATDNLDLFDQASLRNAIEIEIQSINEVEILSSIAASSKSPTSKNLISDAASQRITSIRGRNTDECNSSGPQTFVTAPEEQSIHERLATPQENFVVVAFERLDNYTDSNLMGVLEALIIEYRKYSGPWSSTKKPSFDRLARSSRQQTDIGIIESARGRYDEIIAETPSWVMDRLQQLTAIVKGAIASCAWSNPFFPEEIDRYEGMRLAYEHSFEIDPVLVDDSDAVENVNIFRKTLCKLTQSNQCSHDTSRSCIAIASTVVSVTGERRLLDDLYKVAYFWSFIQCLQFSRVSSSAQIQGVSLSENGWGAQLESIKQPDAEANSIWHSKTMIRDGHTFPRRVMREISDTEDSFMSLRVIAVEGDNVGAIVTFEGPLQSPYRAGIFQLSFVYSERYPNSPPEVKFLTRVYHPNVDHTGKISLAIGGHRR